MCEPTTIMMGISAAISIAGTIASAQGQQKQANAQAEAIANQAQADQNALGLQMNQEASAAAGQANDRNKQALIEAASFDAMSGEFGGGVSADREAANIAFNRNGDLASIAATRDRRLSQLGQEAIGSNSSANASLASLKRPSKLGTALTVAGQAAGAASNIYAAGAAGRKAEKAEADVTIHRTEYLNRQAAKSRGG